MDLRINNANSSSGLTLHNITVCHSRLPREKCQVAARTTYPLKGVWLPANTKTPHRLHNSTTTISPIYNWLQYITRRSYANLCGLQSYHRIVTSAVRVAIALLKARQESNDPVVGVTRRRLCFQHGDVCHSILTHQRVHDCQGLNEYERGMTPLVLF